MAALGQAASLIAHEVKNSLNGMKAAASHAVAPSGDRTLPARTMRGQIRPAQPPRHLAASTSASPRNAQLSLTPVGQLVAEAVESLRVLPEAEEVEVTSELDTSAPRPLRSRSCSSPRWTTSCATRWRPRVAAKDLGRQTHPRVAVQRPRDGWRGAWSRWRTTPAGPPAGVRGAACSSPSSPRSPRASAWASPWRVRRWNNRAGRWRSSARATGSRFTVQLGLERLPHEQVHPSGR